MAAPPIFTGDPAGTELFCSVYEALDPGCCLVAENTRTGRLAGSCFYHPRPTHVSLGIMNVHPNYFGQGVARRLLQAIIEIAAQQNKPLRLVSSAMNLNSFSLYTRAEIRAARCLSGYVSASAGNRACLQRNQDECARRH